MQDENGNTKLVSAFKARVIAQQKAQAQLEKDVQCLKEYEIACNQAGIKTDELAAKLEGASVRAQEYATQIRNGTGSANIYAQNNAVQPVQSVSSTILKDGLSMLKTVGKSLLNMFIFGLALQLASLAFEGIEYILKIKQRKFEELQKKYTDSSEQIQKNKEEENSLDNLIKKYEELASKENMDSSTREEIKQVQYDITDIVGKQASNLDLVNGKLDEQLSKLKEIKSQQLNEDVDDAKNSYDKAKVVENNSRGTADSYGRDFSVKGSNKIFSIEEKIKENVSGINIQDGFLSNILTGGKIFIGLNSDITNIDEKIKTLQNLKDYIISENLKNEDIWDEIYSGVITSIENYESMKDASSDSIKSVVDAIISREANNNGITINSAESYEKSRLQILSSVLSDSTVKEAVSNGDITEDAIRSTVNSVISTLNGFGNYYEDWKKKYLTEDGKTSDELSINNKLDNSKNSARFYKDAHTKIKAGKYIDEFKDQLSRQDFDVLKIFDNLSQEAINSLIEEAIKNQTDSPSKAVAKIIYNVVSKAQSEVIENIEPSSISFDDLFLVTDDSDSTKKELASQFSSLFDQLDKVSSGYNTLKKAQEEYSHAGTLSLSTLKSLMETGDDWLNYLSVENGQLEINTLGYTNLAKAKIQSLKAEMYKGIQEQVSSLQTAADAEKWVEEQSKTSADAYSYETNAIKENTLAILRNNLAKAKTPLSKKYWQDAIATTTAAFDKIDEMISENNLTALMGESDLSNQLSSIKEYASVVNSVQDDIKEKGKITVDTLSSIASTYPSLEKYVNDYMAGVEGSQETLVNELNKCYQTDLNNYKQYLSKKYENDNDFWVKFVNTAGDAINQLANQYGVDLKNYSSYADAIEKINDRIAASTEYVLRLRGAISDLTITDLKNNKNAIIQGLNSDQLRNLDTLWSGWIAKKKNGETITSEQIKNIVGRVLDLDSSQSYQLAAELGNRLAHLDTDSTINGLDDLRKSLENVYGDYAATYVDSISSSLDSSSLKSEDNSSKEDFDWVETKIDRLTEALDKLKDKASDTYSTWATRNSSLQQAINTTKNAIDLQSQAYQTYMNKANSIGLSDTYKSLVQNGALRIDTIYDEALKEKISDYQEWYDKAKDCLDTQRDLQDSLNELNSQKFENLQSEYDSIVDSLEKQKDLLEGQITLLSSASTYSQLRNQQKAVISNLQKERAVLSSTLQSLSITRNSEEWNNLSSKITDIDQSIQEANNALKEIDKLQFDNVKEVFEFNTDKFEHALQLLQDQTDLLETKGLFANEKYYNSMLSYTQQKIDNLQKEKSQLQSILNNSSYQQGTSEWNDMFQSLMDIDEELSSLTNDMVEFNNNIRDLNWDIFKYLEESLSRITSETEYLVELLSKEDLYDKDTGEFTKYATATVGLHAAAYDVYKQQAQDYYEEVQDLQKQLVNGAGKDVLEQYNDMVDAHQEAIKSALEEKQAILDLIEDGYNAQLDALQELIDKKKENMDLEKDLYDYQKSIKEKTENIASLEKQKSSILNDNSEDAMAKIQKIQVELKEAKKDLQETEYEKYLQDSQDMLDQLAEDYEEWMNNRLDNSDALLAEIVGKVGEQGGEIKNTLTEVADKNGTMLSESINTIFSTDSPFTSSLTNGIHDVSNNTVGAVNNVNNTVSKGFTGTTTAINNLIDKVSGITNAIAKNTNAGSNIGGGNGGVSGNGGSGNGSGGSGSNSGYTPSYTPTHTTNSSNSSTSNSSANSSSNASGIFEPLADSYPKNKLDVNTSIVDRLKYNNFNSTFSARARYWKKLGFSGTYTGSAAQNTKMLSWMKSHGYRKGTDYVPKDGYYPTQEDGDEIIEYNGTLLTPLKKGSKVFNNKATKRLYELANNEELLEKFKQQIDSPASFNLMKHGYNSCVQNNTDNNSITFGDTNVTISQANNIEDIVDGLTKSKRFEDMICYVINEKTMGRSTVGKNKFIRH